MVRTLYIVMILAALSLVVSCSSGKKITDPAPQVVAQVVAPLGGKPLSAMPKALIYKMNGDYAQFVPVNLDSSGDRLLSYPGPSDLSQNSEPLPIANGWYLDRRGGVGMNTAFLKYTYAQYMALPSAPSPAELMSDILPDARVTEVKALPITLSQALSDTEALKQYAK